MREITYREALKQALDEEMTRDPGVFLMGEDIAEYGGPFKVVEGLYKKFGKERVRNTPISEAAFVGAAVGAAITGLRPVVEIIHEDFVTVCMDQIANQAAKIRYMFGGQVKVPLVIRAAGGSGKSGAAQHSQNLEAWFAHTPGLAVSLPATPYDAKGLLKTAIRADYPVMFIENKFLYNAKGMVPEEEYTIPFGQANVCVEGDDVTVVAISGMVPRAVAVAERLAKQGVSIEVVDPRTLVPMDADTIIRSVQKTHRLVIAHEAVERCGFGAEIAAVVAKEAFDYLDAPIVRVAAKNLPIPFSSHMERFVLPQESDIESAIREVLGMGDPTPV